MPLDIACVFHLRDIEFIELQTKSFELYLSEEDLGEIFYVWNDVSEIPISFTKTVEVNLRRFKWHLINGVEVFGKNETNFSGWFSQQALKLLVNKFCDSKYCLIFDSKNHLVKNTSIRDFVSKNGKGLFKLDELNGTALKSFQYCIKFLNAELDYNQISAISNRTPFLFFSEIVKNLIYFIENEKNTCLWDLFQTSRLRNDQFLEFFLYQAFIVCNGTKLEFLYEEPSVLNSDVLWATKLSDDNFDTWCTNIYDENVKITGIHWAAVSGLNSLQINRITTIWRQLNLIETLEEGRKIITSTRNRLNSGEIQFAKSIIVK